MPRTRKQAADVRLGRQTPTAAVVLPYTKTLGQDAIDLYNTTGRTAQQWQELLLYDILARNEDDLWVHTKFGYAVPRRNGKNEIAAIRELYGLQQGESILHTAHRTTTSRAAWERLCHLLDKAKIPYKSIQAVGREHIQLEDGEGRIEFRTRSSKGGLGEGFDLLVVDEAQEYTDDQASALKYVVTDSENPQTLFCGTPPTPASSTMRQSAPSFPKSAERIEGLTIAIVYLYAPLSLAVFVPCVSHFAAFSAAKSTKAWLLFSLHENAQKIKPAAVFFTEMT